MPVPLAVIFDLDDTLCDTSGSMLTALAAVSQAIPAFARRSPAELYALQTRIMRALEPQVYSGELTPPQIRVRRFGLMLAELGHSAEGGEAAATVYRAAYRASFRPLAGAGALLAALKERGLRVGVLTNHLREVQLEVLEAVRLLPLIDALVTVSDAPPKPHPGGYRAVCAALGVSPQQAVMVGDHWTNDVAGAVSAGLNGVWYAPAELQAPDDSVPHRRLSSYEPLEDALRAILG
ncbi:HAD family hydrolase [Deinococcus altitudinis]|uniref:HAD family hydrolase n=1 Tax=Deinococcus altitudinis TaxID=468914 RepID=UPI0038924A33